MTGVLRFDFVLHWHVTHNAYEVIQRWSEIILLVHGDKIRMGNWEFKACDSPNLNVGDFLSVFIIASRAHLS